MLVETRSVGTPSGRAIIVSELVRRGKASHPSP